MFVVIKEEYWCFAFCPFINHPVRLKIDVQHCRFDSVAQASLTPRRQADTDDITKVMMRIVVLKRFC